MKWKVQMYSHTALPEPTPTRAAIWDHSAGKQVSLSIRVTRL